MRLLICAGGTGGGVYPALAVLEALNAKRDALDVLWVGGEGGIETELVKRANVPYRSVPAAGVHGVGLRALPGNLTRLTRGVLASRRILREFKPDILFFTGGYVAAPMAVVGKKVPAILYVPDIEPGLALKFLARFANRVALTAPDSKRYFQHPERLIVTGYPLRTDLTNWSREKASRHFGLSSGKPVLLVTGGSRGARSINMAVLKHLNEMLALAQVIHITGMLDWPVVESVAENLPASLRADYHVMPYSHDMGAALAAADLVLSRAGASTLGEYPFFGLPAILAPYPYAWRYQKVNADYLVKRNAAIILHDDLLEDKLLNVIKDLFSNQRQLDEMRVAMKSLLQPAAANAIANQLLELAGEQPL